MALTYRYPSTPRPEPYATSRVPCIPVTLTGPACSLDVVGLLDSGADYALLPSDVANILGIDCSRKTENIGGIGGAMQAIKSTVTITIGQGHEHYTFRIPVYVAVGDLADSFPILIGRRGFFDTFKITFWESRNRLSLKRDAGRQ